MGACEEYERHMLRYREEACRAAYAFMCLYICPELFGITYRQFRYRSIRNRSYFTTVYTLRKCIDVGV